MTSRKQSLSFIWILVFICLISNSCQEKLSKVGMLIASGVFEPDLAYFSDILKKSGIIVISANANYDDKLQISQAKELIDQGATVLFIIAVNTNTSAAIIRLANARNVRTVAYERIIRNCKLDYFISFDNIKIGELLAKEALRFKPAGNYFVMNGDKFDQNAVWVRQGFYNAISPFIKTGQVKVVYDSYVEDWSADNALYELKRYVKLSGIVPDVILSAYNGMNDRIFDYIENESITPIPVMTGQDMDTQELRSATNVKQKISLYKSSRLEVEAATRLASSLLKHETVKIDLQVNNGMIDVNTIVIKDMKIESH